MAIRYCLQCLYGNNENFREMVLMIDGDMQIQNELSLWTSDDDNYQPKMYIKKYWRMSEGW